MTDETAAAGWYPQGDGRQRYWDGTSWTEHFAPVEGNDTSAQAASQKDADAIWQVRGQPLTGIGAGRYKLTERFLFFETGTLRTDSQQIPIASVTDVDVKQSMSQKARGIANVLVHVDRNGVVETVVMADIPDFRDGQRLINETAHQARLNVQKNANTMRYEHSGQPGGPMVPEPSLAGASTGNAPTSDSAADPIEQLERLGKLRDAGVVTGEEFEAKKAEILSRI